MSKAYRITDAKVLQDHEYDKLLKLLEAYDHPHSLLLRLALYTGGRGCEILQVTPAAFQHDPKSRRYTVTLNGAKNSNDRTLDLSEAFYKEVQAYITEEGVGDHERVWPYTTRHLRRIWRAYCPNPNKGIHSLRHTLACRLYNVTKDVLAVKYQCGHVQLNNSMVYLDYVEERRGRKLKLHKAWRTGIDDTSED